MPSVRSPSGHLCDWSPWVHGAHVHQACSHKRGQWATDGTKNKWVLWNERHGTSSLMWKCCSLALALSPHLFFQKFQKTLDHLGEVKRWSPHICLFLYLFLCLSPLFLCVLLSLSVSIFLPLSLLLPLLILYFL